MSVNKTYERIYAAVSRIPEGSVATYGQIAELAGLPGHARQVGYALYAVPANLNIPWQRVVNAKGQISALPDPDSRNQQRKLLEMEGIHFGATGAIDLREYRWQPDIV